MSGRKKGTVRELAAIAAVAGLVSAQVVVTASIATAATPVRLDLRVLLIGGPASGSTPDPTTAAWQTALASEGVPYTLAVTSGVPGAETVTLPPLTAAGDAGHGLFN